MPFEMRSRNVMPNNWSNISVKELFQERTLDMGDGAYMRHLAPSWL